MRVAIVGGGPGGLCLAHGLRRHGVDATVYERDAPDGRRQGYRLHVDARAGLALEQCLPADLFALFLATCGRPGLRFTVLSKRLRELRRFEGAPRTGPETAATLSTSAHRLTLREILRTDLDVRFGRAVSGYDGGTLHFADGATAEADVIVGADGVNSAIRRRLLPGAEVVDTGVRCVYGKTYLDGTTLPLVPPALHDGFAAIVGRGVGVAAGLVRFRESPPAAAARLAPRARLSPVADYLMWAVTADRKRFPADLDARDPAGLHRAAGDLLRTWHPDLRALVAGADVDETFPVRVRTSVPVDAWPPGPVTVLGDAIHAMSPARGSGANTALTDAAVLARTLGPVLATGGDAVAAIGAYETEMRDYGFAAVRASAEAATGRFRRFLHR